MNRVLIFSGTTEGRVLSEILAASEIECDVCVATDYGVSQMAKSDKVRIFGGRLDVPSMKQLYNNNDYYAVVDATHPYATEVTKNIIASLRGYDIPYLRLYRDASVTVDDDLIYYGTVADCVKALKSTTGNILLTTGSKDLSSFCRTKSLTARLFARVLPSSESIGACNKNGLNGRQIIAMQGPFSKETNLALIKQYNIEHIVTKEGGKSGGEDEKLSAAKEAGIKCHVIARPAENLEMETYNCESIIPKLSGIIGKNITGIRVSVTLAGIGCGDLSLLTEEVREKIEGADYIFGAERMLDLVSSKAEKYPYYRKDDIIPKLEEINRERLCNKDVVVLFSGDSGFYSGAAGLYNALSELEYVNVNILPGISSVAYLAAKTGLSYSDAGIISTHGVKEEEWIPKITYSARYNKKTFFISSGYEDINKIGSALMALNLQPDDVSLILGYQLSYNDEEITKLLPRDCLSIKRNGLYAGVILNPVPERCVITPSISDGEFRRGEVPMTKEEVREVTLCKLKLTRNAVLYDIGSGTGSIAVSAARLSPDIKVCAIEYKTEAAKLIQKNISEFGAFNVDIIEAKAPLGMDNLPMATHAFIGGSKGNLRSILDKLHSINPYMRVVMNGISLESVSEMTAIVKEYPIDNLDIVSVQASRIKEVGTYHMPEAMNPVYIFSFDFLEDKPEKEKEEPEDKKISKSFINVRSESKRIL